MPQMSITTGVEDENSRLKEDVARLRQFKLRSIRVFKIYTRRGDRLCKETCRRVLRVTMNLDAA